MSNGHCILLIKSFNLFDVIMSLFASCDPGSGAMAYF